MQLLSLLVFSLSQLLLSDGTVFSTVFERSLNSFVDASMKCRHVPGMTLSVVKGDDVWSQGYGKEDISTNKSVDSNSKFNIGSITKSFTATLLGILLSEKGLDWTTKVTDILGPTYEFVDPYRTKEMTIRDMLSHRTGLARLDFGGNGAGIPKSVSRSEFCRRLKYLPEELPFRDGFLYNNYIYMMAGHVAEILGQDTWENLMLKKVLLPLGMDDTKYMLQPEDVLAPKTARPYVFMHRDDEFVNGTLELYSLHPIEPAGAIMSTATDMAKWMNFHLSLGETWNGTQLLDQERVKDIHQVTTASISNQAKTKPRYPVDDVDIGYGYGISTSEYRGYRKIWHSGGWGSYISLMWIFPDMNFGVFGSVNGPSSGYDSDAHLWTVFYYISDHLLGLEPWLNETTACFYPEPWSQPPNMRSNETETPIPVTNIGELEGTYRSKIFTDLVVYTNSTVLHMDSNRLHAILHPSSEKDRFLYELLSPAEYAYIYGNDTYYAFNVTFNRDSTTRIVNAVTLHLEVDVVYNKQTGPEVIG